MTRNLFFWQNFIKSEETEDNPSCFPGFISRLARIAEKDALFKMPKEKKVLLDELLAESIIKKLDQCFSKENAEGALFLSDAITGLRFNNAIDILSNEAKSNQGYMITRYTDDYLEKRQEFVRQLINNNLDGFISEIEKKLAANEATFFITPIDRAYIEFYLASLAEPAVLASIGQVFTKHHDIPVTFEKKDGIEDCIKDINENALLQQEWGVLKALFMASFDLSEVKLRSNAL